VDIAAGAPSPDIDDLLAAGNRVFFKAIDAAGEEPWISDGTAAGTHRVGDINPGAEGSSVDHSINSSVAAVGATVFFSAYDPVHGAELWRLKAGEELAALVTDFNTELTLVQPPLGQPAHTVGSEPRGLTASGDSVLFTAVITAGFTRTNKL
jgi:ELWxxDGT repeat protein